MKLPNSPGDRGRGDLGVEPPAKTCNCKFQPNRQSYVATWRIQTRTWVDLPISTAIPPFSKLIWCLVLSNFYIIHFNYSFVALLISSCFHVFCISKVQNNLVCSFVNVCAKRMSLFVHSEPNLSIQLFVELNHHQLCLLGQNY